MMRNTIKAGLVGLSMIFGTHASAENIDNASFAEIIADQVLKGYNVNPSNLQWDELRERDILGKDHCFDYDEDNVADTVGHTLNATNEEGEQVYSSDGQVLTGDTYRYSLMVIDGEGAFKNHFDLSKQDAVITLQKQEVAIGFLFSPYVTQADQKPTMVAVYKVKGGTIQSVARPNSDKPTGEAMAYIKGCDSLKMP